MAVRSVCFAGVLLSALACPANAQPLRPGEYVTEGGWGQLAIARAKNGALTFSIDAYGANAHICTLEGPVRQGMAVLDGGVEGAPCKVQFTPFAAGVHVTIAENRESCREFCGARAGFDGDYLKPAAGCAPSALNATRREFKSAYDGKQFAKARTLLEPMLTRCAKTMDAHQSGRIRNDIAIAQYRAGDLEACRATLAGFGPDLEETEDEVKGNYPPSDAANWWPIVRAARTNMKLCKGPR